MPAGLHSLRPGTVGTTKAEEALAAIRAYDGTSTRVTVEIEYVLIPGITPAASRYVGAIRSRFGNIPMGLKAVRYIAGTSTWSQHAYGNAVDVMAGEPSPLHREIAYWTDANRGSLSIAHLLADPYFPSPLGDHFNHVHADFYPQWGGTPPGHPI